MSKIAIINDTHCGIRNSSDIFLDNAAKFYNKTFFPYCVENNIKQIIHLGDYYDNRKHLNIKSLYRNRKDFIEPMIDNGMTMDIIPGNHDTYFKNTNPRTMPPVTIESACIKPRSCISCLIGAGPNAVMP